MRHQKATQTLPDSCVSTLAPPSHRPCLLPGGGQFLELPQCVWGGQVWPHIPAGGKAPRRALRSGVLSAFFCDHFCCHEGISREVANLQVMMTITNVIRQLVTLSRALCFARYMHLILKLFISVRGSPVIIPIFQIRKPRLVKIMHLVHGLSVRAKIQIWTDECVH